MNCVKNVTTTITMTVLAGMKNERVIFRSEAFIWQNAAAATATIT